MDGAGIEDSIERGILYENAASERGASALLVCVPGWRLAPSAFRPLLRALMQEDFLADGDLLPYAYDNGRYSNAAPEQVAQQLADALDTAFRHRRYRAVYLLGHSIGALIVRRAFLIGHERGAAWVPVVARLVLLAGVNRGFTPATLRDRIGAFAVSSFNLPFAALIMNCQRGAPWVTALRMRWLRLFSDGDVRPPDVVQFYGSLDRVVAADDASEVNRFDNARFVSLEGVDHEGFASIAGPANPHYATIRDAIREKVETTAAARREERDRLVFLIHGIRDFAEWQDALEYEIETRQRSVAVVPVQYGYFNILQFLLPHQGKRAVRVFVDRYVQEVSKSPSATVAVGAHSNGTWVFERALEDSPFMEVERAFLAGSVLPRTVAWSDYRDDGRVRNVRNVTASNDWPVGFLCRGLKWLRPSMGTAGYHGFDDPSVDNRRLAGGHGAALEPHHRTDVARYLIGEDAGAPDSDAPSSASLKVFSFTAVTWLILLLAAIVGLYWLIASSPLGAGAAVAGSAALTLFLVWLLQKV